MPARFCRERCVTTLVGLVRLSFNRHSPRLFSCDCVDSLTLHRIVYKFSNGIHNVFVLSLALMIAGLIAVFFLKEVPLQGGRSRSATTIEAVEDVAPEGNVAAII